MQDSAHLPTADDHATSSHPQSTQGGSSEDHATFPAAPPHLLFPMNNVLTFAQAHPANGHGFGDSATAAGNDHFVMFPVPIQDSHPQPSGLVSLDNSVPRPSVPREYAVGTRTQWNHEFEKSIFTPEEL